MSELDKLLNTDHDNVSNSKKGLTAFDRGLPEALDDAAGMFGAFRRYLGGAAAQNEASDRETIDQYAKRAGIPVEDVLGRLSAETLKDTSAQNSSLPCQAYARSRSRDARAILFLLLERNFMWGATDLLRMRLTAAEGYGRLEAEATALLILIRDDPVTGTRWMNIRSDSEGRAFFNKTKGAVGAILRDIDLLTAYERGSGMGQHVRFASAALGLSWPSLGTTMLKYQEVNRGDLFPWFLAVLVFLATQVRVFRALSRAFPEVAEPIWGSRVVCFNNNVAQLWARLSKKFPERCKELGQP